MGKTALIMVFGFSALFSMFSIKLNRYSSYSIDNSIDHYKNTMARNCSSSGAYMALSKIFQDNSWQTGFSEKALNSGSLTVDIQDRDDDASISVMDIKIVSTGTFDNFTKTTEVLLRDPPNLEDLAVFCTDTIENVTIFDETRTEDWDLAIQHADEMLPYDTDALVTIANSQPGHVISGDFIPPDEWPNGNYYFDEDAKIPNVTHVLGDLRFFGNFDAYGIFIVEGNATLDGTARIYGVIYLPNPGSLVIHGGGIPKESSVYGGVYANGNIDGTGNHISIQYNSEYMDIFGQFQIDKEMHVLSWTELPGN